MASAPAIQRGCRSICKTRHPTEPSIDAQTLSVALPPVKRGDLLAIFTAGAYGFTMASNYNARPLAAEVLTDGDTWKTIRKRQTYADLIAPEV